MKSSNFDIVQGDSFVLVATYRSSEKTLEFPKGVPIDLTGYSVTFQVKDQPDGKVLCATATVGNGITIDGPNGVINVNLTPAQTKKFTVPKAAYQLQIDSGTVKTTIANGWFQVERGVI